MFCLRQYAFKSSLSHLLLPTFGEKFRISGGRWQGGQNLTAGTKEINSCNTTGGRNATNIIHLHSLNGSELHYSSISFITNSALTLLQYLIIWYNLNILGLVEYTLRYPGYLSRESTEEQNIFDGLKSQFWNSSPLSCHLLLPSVSLSSFYSWRFFCSQTKKR